MAKFISMTNSVGGQTLYMCDQISAVEDLMGQTKLMFSDGTAEVVSESAASVISQLGFTHTFPTRLGTIHTDIDRITRLASSVIGDADVYFGRSKVEVESSTGKSLAAILAAL